MINLSVCSLQDAGMNAENLKCLRNSIQQDIDEDLMFGGVMIVTRSGKIVMREAFGFVEPGGKPKSMICT